LEIDFKVRDINIMFNVSESTVDRTMRVPLSFSVPISWNIERIFEVIWGQISITSVTITIYQKVSGSEYQLVQLAKNSLKILKG